MRDSYTLLLLLLLLLHQFRHDGQCYWMHPTTIDDH